jgi:outer membrane protein
MELGEMRMRLSLFAAAVLGLTPGLACANELLKVYDLAVAHDTQIAAAGYARDAALQSRPQARSALLPLITGSYSYSKGRSEGEFSQSTLSTFDLDGDGVDDDSDGDGVPDLRPVSQGAQFSTNDTDRKSVV